MSSQTPRPRRRIAGERRPVRTDADQPTDVTTDTGLEDSPETSDPVLPPDPAPEDTTVEPLEAVDPDALPEEATGTALPEPGRSGPSWTVVTVLGVATVLVLALALALGLFRWDVRDVRRQDRVQEATRSAPAVAERAAAAILAYDYSTLDADEKSAERYLTPSYKKRYVQTFTKLVKPNAAKVRARVKADVKASGVTQADPDRVTVLLYVNQTTTSTANSGEPQVALNRVQLTMVRQGGTWKVDQITSY